MNYFIFLDGVFEAQTTDTEYQFVEADFTEDEYILGVKAAYEGGDSDIATMVWGFILKNGNTDSPVVTALGGNIPNPFNPITVINYSIKDAGQVSVVVYNAKGQYVKTLVDAAMDAGEHSVSWEGTNENGNSVKSGVYFYRMKSGRYTSTKKMILLK